MNDVFSIKNGSIKAFESAYHHWSGRIYTFILKQCHSEEIAEEVVQLAFVRLWEKREQLSLEHNLSTQLFRMSKTIFIDELRKTAQSRKYQERVQRSGAASFTENTLEHKEALQIVYQAIEQMPPVRKQIFLMSRMEHLSYQEIAEKLGISPKTVENHMALALKYLRGFTPLMIVLHLL
ncbi:RNA polymerase sigma-70 factor [Pedobacter caeni]|uniref:RNA polymerase sigma-70 factor, ECF subfamily n=1 Tax=Pedobacter caeni TaxID=288992 RepID=A0A1M5JV76_9SPHI|nr:RNA polymerase sigma-70 factor [Pedobacter caeni]SHG44467.1 RNA polymerase sigma-70 factor, ECF subfamily [Pedobacter caeni]